MARDRKRSKQRRARRPAPVPDAHQPEPGMPDVEPVVSEAVGPPVLPGPVEPAGESEAGNGREYGLDPAELGLGAEDPESDAALASVPSRPPASPKPSGNRVAAFMRASWAELQRVQWPDRRQVGQATAVVLGFVVIAGSFLGLADLVASNIVDAIL